MSIVVFLRDTEDSHAGQARRGVFDAPALAAADEAANNTYFANNNALDCAGAGADTPLADLGARPGTQPALFVRNPAEDLVWKKLPAASRMVSVLE